MVKLQGRTPGQVTGECRQGRWPRRITEVDHQGGTPGHLARVGHRGRSPGQVTGAGLRREFRQGGSPRSARIARKGPRTAHNRRSAKYGPWVLSCSDRPIEAILSRAFCPGQAPSGKSPRSSFRFSVALCAPMGTILGPAGPYVAGRIRQNRTRNPNIEYPGPKPDTLKP